MTRTRKSRGEDPDNEILTQWDRIQYFYFTSSGSFSLHHYAVYLKYIGIQNIFKRNLKSKFYIKFGSESGVFMSLARIRGFHKLGSNRTGGTNLAGPQPEEKVNMSSWRQIACDRDKLNCHTRLTTTTPRLLRKFAKNTLQNKLLSAELNLEVFAVAVVNCGQKGASLQDCRHSGLIVSARLVNDIRQPDTK